ncbi:MAG: hypothetical protein HY814_03085 [Candidatus Riflebacteria bacterium]|nr:hypothetical protein [Candidatus Riflebacteria bacterium]
MGYAAGLKLSDRVNVSAFYLAQNGYFMDSTNADLQFCLRAIKPTGWFFRGGVDLILGVTDYEYNFDRNYTAFSAGNLAGTFMVGTGVAQIKGSGGLVGIGTGQQVNENWGFRESILLATGAETTLYNGTKRDTQSDLSPDGTILSVNVENYYKIDSRRFASIGVMATQYEDSAPHSTVYWGVGYGF